MTNKIPTIDVDLFSLLELRPKEGKILLGKDRMLLMRQDAFARLWFLMSEQLGKKLSRSIISKFGYQCGLGDYTNLSTHFKTVSESERLSLGPMMHALEGIVYVEPLKFDFNLEKREFYFNGIWRNSFEAEIYLEKSGGELSSSPECFALTGYASGWCSAFCGFDVVAVETKCVAKGDHQCEWEIKDRAACGEYEQDWISHLDSDEKSIAKTLEEVNRDLILKSNELVRANHKVSRASQAKSDFLSKMSHEIRTPLNIFMGAYQLLEDSLAENETEEVKSYIEMMKMASENLLSLVNNVLDLSKIEAGRLEILNKEFDLKEVATEVKKFFSLKTKKHIKIFIEDSILTIVNGDPQLIKQILINLVANAIKFSKDEVKISISKNEFSDRRGNYLLYVEDNGLGLTEEQVNKLFNRFTQVEEDEVYREGGSGLGLTICKEFVGALGGEIWVESLRESYTKVFFTLNLQVTTKIESEKCIDQSDSLLLNSKKLLIVDDAEENLFLVSKFFQHSNCIIETALSGEEAIKLFMRSHPDLVFMDIRMKTMSGLDAVKVIRQYEVDQKLERSKIVALSANSFKSDIELSLNAGCDAHLSKPVRKSDIINCAKGLLKNGKRE